MKNIYFKSTLLFALSGIISCEVVPDFDLDDTTPVVEAFLYVGDAVDDIKITEVIPFASEIADNEVNGLDIEITQNGNSFP